MNNFIITTEQKKKHINFFNYNWNWKQVFEKRLISRGNWKPVNFETAIKQDTPISFSYSTEPLIFLKSVVNANLYNINVIMGNKRNIVETLEGKEYIPQSIFINSEKENIVELSKNLSLLDLSTTWYLKPVEGRGKKIKNFIISSISEVIGILNTQKNVKKWILSKNVNSYLHKIDDGEKYGHRGKMRVMVLFVNNSKSYF